MLTHSPIPGNLLITVKYHIGAKTFTFTPAIIKEVVLFWSPTSTELRTRLATPSPNAAVQWVAAAGVLVGFTTPKPFRALTEAEKRMRRLDDFIIKEQWDSFVNGALQQGVDDKADPIVLTEIDPNRGVPLVKAPDGTPVGPSRSVFLGWAGPAAYGIDNVWQFPRDAFCFVASSCDWPPSLRSTGAVQAVRICEAPSSESSHGPLHCRTRHRFFPMPRPPT